jgi:tryptophan halogenase
MTAAAIARQLPHIKLTLVESAAIPTIGVGESTIGHINQYLHLLGLKDEDWMRHCGATYKTSIKFIDFRETPSETPHSFHYPFGSFDLVDKPRGVMEWFLARARDKTIPPSHFAEFFHDNILMTNANKMTKNEMFELRNFNFFFDTAYHMDAALFGNYLRDHICLPSGMTHIIDTVAQIVQNEDLSIKEVVTENHGAITADLFVDCTGFKSLLLEQTLGVPFESFSNTLLNDSAVATIIPYLDKDRELESVTSCTAIDCGWVWNIPLWDRIGTGYVYSSKFATPEEAEAQFRKHLKSNRMIVSNDARADAAEFRHIKIKHGVHERAWEKNVVAVGLSNGFIEPLESTGLMLTHEAIVKLVATLTMREGHVTQFDVDLFNCALYDQVIGFKEFISQHYAFSRRNDTAYWQAVTGKTTYSLDMNQFNPTIQNSYYDLAFKLHRTRNFNHQNMSGIIYIAAGMGVNPIDAAHADYLDIKYLEKPGYSAESLRIWEEHKQHVLAKIEKMPSHCEFLAKNIYFT